MGVQFHPPSFQYENSILIANKSKKKPHQYIMGQMFSQDSNSPPGSPTLARKAVAEVEAKIQNETKKPGTAVSEAELKAKAEAEEKAILEAEAKAKAEAEEKAKLEAEAKAKAEAEETARLEAEAKAKAEAEA